jgi:hypothetical protein
VYGRRKRYIKIHFAVDINTREVISMDVTTDIHDSEVLPRMLKDASINRDVIKAYTIQGIHTSFSTYKRLYGEHTMSRNIENMERELKAKAYIIQHTNRHACEIRKDKQKKKPER